MRDWEIEESGDSSDRGVDGETATRPTVHGLYARGWTGRDIPSGRTTGGTVSRLGTDSTSGPDRDRWVRHDLDKLLWVPQDPNLENEPGPSSPSRPHSGGSPSYRRPNFMWTLYRGPLWCLNGSFVNKFVNE